MLAIRVIPILAAAWLAAACAGNLRQWPIDALILPAEATPAPFPQFVKAEGMGDFSTPNEIHPSKESMSWGKGFDYPLGWERLISHFESQLGSVGYSPYDGPEFAVADSLPGDGKRQFMRAYMTTDGKYKVALLNTGYLKSLAYKQGRIQPELEGADYLLIIDRARR